MCLYVSRPSAESWLLCTDIYRLSGVSGVSGVSADVSDCSTVDEKSSCSSRSVHSKDTFNRCAICETTRIKTTDRTLMGHELFVPSHPDETCFSWTSLYRFCNTCFESHRAIINMSLSTKCVYWSFQLCLFGCVMNRLTVLWVYVGRECRCGCHCQRLGSSLDLLKNKRLSTPHKVVQNDHRCNGP